MARLQTRGFDGSIIVYKFSVEWVIYNITGEEIDRGNKLFETKEKAKDFAQKFKTTIPTDKNADVTIRALEGNQIVRRLKKRAGRKNYSRR